MLLIQVSVEKVIKQMKVNSSKAIELLLAAIPLVGQRDWQDVIAQNKVI